MARLTIASIDATIDEETNSLSRRILGDLRKRKLYNPNLMYRGVNVNDDGIQKIARYGTDRNPEDAKRVTTDNVYEYLPDMKGLRRIGKEFGIEDGTFERSIKDESDPRLIWALPKEGLARCIDEYAFNGEAKPVILVYKPEFLVHEFHGHMWHGKVVPELIKEFGRKKLAEADDVALYRFREGTKPIDAAVIAYVIQRSNA